MTAADDLRALSAAATEGPWEKEGTRFVAGPWRDGLTVVVAKCPQAPDAELIVWLRNHADAIADLIDAAEALVQPAGWWVGVEQRQEHQLLDRRAVVRDALAALEATDGPH